MLTFWHWLAEGASSVEVPMGDDAIMRLRLPPMILTAPFGIETPDDHVELPDEEDSQEPGDAEDEGSDDDPDYLDTDA